eukprot:6563464-Karenia_brevis.AAC.1
MRSQTGGDVDAVSAPHQAYIDKGLVRDPKKDFGFANKESDSVTGASEFISWGAEVRSGAGSVATRLDNRRQISAIMLMYVSMPCLRKELLQRAVGLS